MSSTPLIRVVEGPEPPVGQETVGGQVKLGTSVVGGKFLGEEREVLVEDWDQLVIVGEATRLENPL